MLNIEKSQFNDLYIKAGKFLIFSALIYSAVIFTAVLYAKKMDTPDYQTRLRNAYDGMPDEC